MKKFLAFLKTIPAMPPASYAPPRPDLILADLKKVGDQLVADGFDDNLGMTALSLFITAYMVLPILLLTGMIG